MIHSSSPTGRLGPKASVLSLSRWAFDRDWRLACATWSLASGGVENILVEFTAQCLSRMAAMHFSQAVSPSQTACEVPVAPLSCLLHTHCFWAALCRLIPVLKLWFRQAWLSRVCAGGNGGCGCVLLASLWVYEKLSESKDANEVLSGSRDSVGYYRILAPLALEKDSVSDTTCYVRWDS